MAITEKYITGTTGAVNQGSGDTVEATISVPAGEVWYIEEFRSVAANLSSDADGSNDLHIRLTQPSNAVGAAEFRTFQNQIGSGNAGDGDRYDTSTPDYYAADTSLEVISHGSGSSISVDDIEFEVVMRRVI